VNGEKKRGRGIFFELRQKEREGKKVLTLRRARRERKNHYRERKEYAGMFSFMFLLLYHAF